MAENIACPCPVYYTNSNSPFSSHRYHVVNIDKVEDADQQDKNRDQRQHLQTSGITPRENRIFILIQRVGLVGVKILEREQLEPSIFTIRPEMSEFGIFPIDLLHARALAQQYQLVAGTIPVIFQVVVNKQVEMKRRFGTWFPYHSYYLQGFPSRVGDGLSNRVLVTEYLPHKVPGNHRVVKVLKINGSQE